MCLGGEVYLTLRPVCVQVQGICLSQERKGR